MPTTDGGPAFPTINEHSGLTKRDYFAARAMQGLVASGYTPFAPKGPAPPWADEIARLAYQMADAILAERERAR